MDLNKLKQDAEKSLDKRLGTYAYIRKQDCYTNYVDGYIDGAEPREKRIKELEKQVKEWKALQEMFDGKSFKLEGEITNLHKQILKLEKENAELKKEWQEQVQKATDEGYARTLQTIQLTKAKEIIREFVEWATWQGNSKCPSFKSIQDKAEQFLNSEVEK